MFSPGTLRVYPQEGYSTSVEERDVMMTLRVVGKKQVSVATLNNVEDTTQSDQLMLNGVAGSPTARGDLYFAINGCKVGVDGARTDNKGWTAEPFNMPRQLVGKSGVFLIALGTSLQRFEPSRESIG